MARARQPETTWDCRRGRTDCAGHLVDAREQRGRHGEAEGLRSDASKTWHERHLQIYRLRRDADLSARIRRVARHRSLVVIASFTTAMLVAFVAPRLGFGLICGPLILHFWPEAPGSRL
jgi:hypothetical protein